MGWISAVNGTYAIGEHPQGAVPFYLGEGFAGEMVMGSHLEDLGSFWFCCCEGSHPEGVGHYYRVESLDLTVGGIWVAERLG